MEEGQTSIPVGTPLAVFVEHEDQVEEGKGWSCPTTNVYDEKQPSVAMLTWQSFLKTASRQVKCMG